MKKNNEELACIFSGLAAYYEMAGVPFKPQAYELAASSMEGLAEDIGVLYKKGGRKALEEIPGVGRSIALQAEEFLKTGKVKKYEAERKKMPVDLEDLLAIEGVGAKTVKELYRALRIKTVADLEKAATAGKIRKLPGFGEKSEENILQGIAFVKKEGGRQLLGKAYPYVEELLGELKSSGFADQAVAAGSFRRMKETVGDIDILAVSGRPEHLMKFFLKKVPHTKVWGTGATKTSVRTRHGFDIDLRVLPKAAYGAGLQYFTGSKEHNIRVRAYAASKGLKVSEYGVFKGAKRIAGRTEEEVYNALGMEAMAPELREDTGEVEAALKGKLPKVIPYGSLKGDLQVQTSWSDGADSIEVMALAAREQGLEYIAVTDHTRDLAMTGGLDEKKLELQAKEIDKLNRKFRNFRVLKGAEVNIRKDGSLDIADSALARLDVVGVSVHGNFKMSKAEQTRRILKAMRNPYVDILFHPTGRLIQKRAAYEVDMEAIVAAAAETGVALEVNAYPERLDLKDAHIRMAVEAGAKLVINSDAHAADHFRVLKFGIAQARRGWAAQNDVLNTKPVGALLSSLRSTRTKKK